MGKVIREDLNLGTGNCRERGEVGHVKMNQGRGNSVWPRSPRTTSNQQTLEKATRGKTGRPRACRKGIALSTHGDAKSPKALGWRARQYLSLRILGQSCLEAGRWLGSPGTSNTPNVCYHLPRSWLLSSFGLYILLDRVNKT